MKQAPRILYCHCTYAQVVPKETKEKVLKALCDAGISFDAVADLCEMSARKDPSLQRLASDGQVKIAACFPRAVKWLFAASGTPLNTDQTEVLNMRVDSPEAICQALLKEEISPNLPTGKITMPAEDFPPVTTTPVQAH